MDQLIAVEISPAPVLLMALVFYLIAGWRTFQVIMLTSDRRDPTAHAYSAGTFPMIFQAGFIVLWVPILASTFVLAYGEKLAAWIKGRRNGGAL